MRGAAAVLGVLLLLAGGQQGPPRPPVTGAVVASAIRLKGEGDALAARGDYAGAAARHREALAHDPASVPVRFALGVALSHLDRRAEAIDEFRWVIARADKGSLEYGEARSWLVRVGALVEFGRGDSGARTTAEAATGRLVGQTEWPGVDPRGRAIEGRVSVTGDGEEARGVQKSRPFRISRGFEFRDLPPGTYQLVAKVGNITLWDQKVTVEGGRDIRSPSPRRTVPSRPRSFRRLICRRGFGCSSSSRARAPSPYPLPLLPLGRGTVCQRAACSLMERGPGPI